MDRYKETFDTWNSLAGAYENKFMNLDLYNDTYDYICNSIVKQGAKLLEIGCGPGNITKYLLSQRADFEILGIDIAPNMIELAKKNNPTAKFAVMDCREISGLDEKYDGIIAGFCLPYLSPDECNELISDAYNLLNENGLIYLSFVEGDPVQSGFKKGSGGRVYFQFHNLEEVKGQLLLKKFGQLNTFKINYKISETESDIHTILTAKKSSE